MPPASSCLQYRLKKPTDLMNFGETSEPEGTYCRPYCANLACRLYSS